MIACHSCTSKNKDAYQLGFSVFSFRLLAASPALFFSLRRQLQFREYHRYQTRKKQCKGSHQCTCVLFQATSQPAQKAPRPLPFPNPPLGYTEPTKHINITIQSTHAKLLTSYHPPRRHPEAKDQALREAWKSRCL